ncbi:MAG: imidazolonepropionase [Mesorhizobium sp.]
MAGSAQSGSEKAKVWRNAHLATFAEVLPGMGIVENGAVAVRNGRISYAGPEAELPTEFSQAETIDCEGRWITPGLIDCHTHLVYAGNRANEFEMRLAGASYEEVARAGGGIVSSVKSLRAASEDDLVQESSPRRIALMAEGVTTIEIKSGYGLDLENEAKALRAARRLGFTPTPYPSPQGGGETGNSALPSPSPLRGGVWGGGSREQNPVTVRTTFLGAHALPPEANGDKDAYIAKVVEEMLPAIAAEGLADAVDGFCEGIAFSPDQIARVFDKARSLGLPVKLHADQLSDLGGAALAARYGALSADHLEYTNEDGARAMAQAGTVAVLLPGAFYFIRETKKPPVDLFRKHGMRMALATDSNPGTSPLTSLLLTMNMGATLFSMTVEECLAGVTRNAARALGLLAETGTLEVGKWADLAIWNIERPAELVYRMGFNPLHARIWRGQ